MAIIIPYPASKKDIEEYNRVGSHLLKIFLMAFVFWEVLGVVVITVFGILNSEPLGSWYMYPLAVIFQFFLNMIPALFLAYISMLLYYFIFRKRI